jgi:hypothetical protein
MKITIPNCSRCGPLDSLEGVDHHNRLCANTGELNGADMLMAAFPPKFAGRSAGAKAAL